MLGPNMHNSPAFSSGVMEQSGCTLKAVGLSERSDPVALGVNEIALDVNEKERRTIFSFGIARIHWFPRTHRMVQSVTVSESRFQ